MLQKPKKLRAQVTRPLREDTRMYWRCPGKGCHYYHNVLVGLHPERLQVTVNCPACHTYYLVSSLGTTSGHPLIIAAPVEKL